MRKYFTTVFLLTLSAITNAQKVNVPVKKDFFNDKYFTVWYQNGYVFPANDFVRRINAENDVIDAFHTFTLKFTKHTTGKQAINQKSGWALIFLMTVRTKNK